MNDGAHNVTRWWACKLIGLRGFVMSDGALVVVFGFFPSWQRNG